MKYQKQLKEGIVLYDNTAEELKQIDDQKIYEVFVMLSGPIIPAEIEFGKQYEYDISVEKYHTYLSGKKVKEILEDPFKNIFSKIQIKVGFVLIFENTYPKLKYFGIHMKSYDLNKYAPKILKAYTEYDAHNMKYNEINLKGGD
ncbi:MAG: hypothetical protein QXP36_14470 [Conexivisphaerales archaeon]